MTTIHVTMSSQLDPGVVLAASYDFSARRADVFPAVSTEHLEVHDIHPGAADVTEGTPVGIGLNWERCRYDWATPGVVTADVVASNVYEPAGSRWVLRASPDAGGSRIEMIWVREFRPGPRGLVFGTLFRLLGKPIFTRYANQVIRNIESLAIAGR
jgi:hypothetical protein